MNPTTSFANQLMKEISEIIQRQIGFLEKRQFERYLDQVSPIGQMFGNKVQRPTIKLRPSGLSPAQQRDQRKLKHDFLNWKNDFSVVAEYVSGNEEIKLLKIVAELERFITYPGISGNPLSYKEAISRAIKNTENLQLIVEGFIQSEENSEIYVLDTNIIIDYPGLANIVDGSDGNTKILIIPSTVFIELDDLKTGKRDELFRKKMTSATKKLNQFYEIGNPLEGISLVDGIIIKFIALEPNFAKLPSMLDPLINDDRIIGAFLEIQRQYPFSNVTLITNDLSMQNKAKLMKIPVINRLDES